MTAQWLLNWYNLIFIVPFALALVYLGLYTLSGWTFGDADVDADHDVDIDADGHIDLHVEHNLDHHVDPHAHHPNASATLAVLTWFGLGRVPLSILLMTLMLSWGVFGFAASSYAKAQLPHVEPWMVSVPVAVIASLLITKVLAGFFGRYLPTTETYARRRHDLLGQVGETVFPVDRSFGMVAVRGRSGELFQLPCRLEAGDRVIPKGTKVQLVAYNAQEKLFYVIESEFAASERSVS